jgi:hypothetical protein
MPHFRFIALKGLSGAEAVLRRMGSGYNFIAGINFSPKLRGVPVGDPNVKRSPIVKVHL